MRLLMLVLLVLTTTFGVVFPTLVEAQGLGTSVLSSSVSAAQDQPKLDVDINVNKGGGGGGAWYASPVWIAIGALAAVVVLALLVMAMRGGGTTVVKG